MPSISRSVIVVAPPARVFEAFTNLDSWLTWVRHFREVTPLSDGPLAPGYRARIRYKLCPAITVWAVSELVPGRSFAWGRASFAGLRLTVDHAVEPAGAGARATLTVRIEGAWAPLVGLVAGPLSWFTFDRSLAALKGRLEAPVRDDANPYLSS